MSTVVIFPVYGRRPKNLPVYFLLLLANAAEVF
jgi:hypothetical protein